MYPNDYQEFVQRVMALLQEGQKIQAIKEYRLRYPDAGLKEAKGAIDLLQAGMTRPAALEQDVLRVIALRRQLKEIKTKTPYNISHEVDEDIQSVIDKMGNWVLDRV